MGYRKELKEKSVEGTEQRFDIIDSRFVFPTKLDLFLEENTDLYSIQSFTVKGSDGVEYYRCSYNLNTIIVYSMYGEPLCNIEDSQMTFKNKQTIYRGTSKDVLSTVKAKDSTVGFKFVVEFTNLSSEKTELFDMNCDIQYRACGIFYGKEKSGAPMVCKILKNCYYASLFKIEIAPGIDSAFMVALSLLFMKRSVKNRQGPAVIVKNYFTGIPCKEVEAPNFSLAVVDSKYISEIPQMFKIEKVKAITSDYDFRIYNMDDVELYKSKQKLLKQVLQLSENDEPIISIVDSTGERIKKRIFLGKKEEQCVGNIREIKSNVLNKYSIEFLNSKTEIFESFTMNCDIDFYTCTILYDNNQGKISLVARIFKDQYEKRYYQLEIAPGVDQMIIFAAAIYFTTKSSNVLSYENDKNNY